jgi:hypothetical protein
MRAQAFDAKFDASSLEELSRRLGHVPEEAVKEVRKSNRAWAGRLRDDIREKTPRLSAASRKRQGKRHDTRPGMLRTAVTSRAGTESAAVVARASKVPHFRVMEFGGAVLWKSTKTGKTHRIPVRPRSASLKAAGVGRRGASGYFFWPTIRERLPAIRDSAVKGAGEAIRRALPSRID